MKILVYYLGVGFEGWTDEDFKNAADAKLKELQEKFPYFKDQILVVPLYDSKNDRIEVLDMSPQYYPPTGIGYASGYLQPNYIPQPRVTTSNTSGEYIPTAF